MAPTYHLDDLWSWEQRIDMKDSNQNLFKEKTGHAGFQVTRIFRGNAEKHGESQRNVFLRDLNVFDVSQVKLLRDDNCDTTQIYTIRQDYSWTTLNISRGFFEDFMKAHSMMPTFWKHIFTFGRKNEEHEFEFPHFARRKTGTWLRNGLKTHEYAYVLRRVERHGRRCTKDGDPWSIRQTAVYHKISMPEAEDNLFADGIQKPKRPRSTFLLVAPSESVESQVEQCLMKSTTDNAPEVKPWTVHRILVADSLRGWMEYMAYLELLLKNQSNGIILADVGDSKENLSPLTDFVINFEDRQRLKNLEDKVLALQVILPGILDAVVELRKEFLGFTETFEASKNDELDELHVVIDEFDEHTREVGMLIERSKALKDMASSTTRLLSDLLSYEEAVSLKNLSAETQKESRSMCHLAEKSTKDAAAVKILTVITLIYLPFTIVANFFSTQFVQTKDDGHIHFARNVWLLAAVGVPLTMLTIGLWWTWVHFTELTPTEDPQGTMTLQRQHSFRSIMSSIRKPKQKDLESGLGSPTSPTSQLPQSFPNSPTSTWSSQATTVKSG